MFSGLNLFIEQNNGPPASLAFAQVSVHVNRICYWKIFSKYQGTIHKIKGYTDGIKYRQVGVVFGQTGAKDSREGEGQVSCISRGQAKLLLAL